MVVPVNPAIPAVPVSALLVLTTLEISGSSGALWDQRGLFKSDVTLPTGIDPPANEALSSSVPITGANDPESWFGFDFGQARAADV